MAASKRFMNWTSTTFTIAGSTPTVINITGVGAVSFDDGGSLAKFAGDGDRYNSMIVNDFNDPTATVMSADIAALQSLPTGTIGTFSTVFNDAKNKTGTGAITFTLLAIVAGNSTTGKHRAFGEGTLKLEGMSADGQTNPLSSSVAP